MRKLKGTIWMIAAMLLAAAPALADKYSETIDLFKNAGQSGTFFGNSYGYAVFPTIGKAGMGIDGAHGAGRVYEKGKYVGDTKMTQLSIGFGRERWRGGDHSGRVGDCHHGGLDRDCQRRQEGRSDGRQVG